MIGVVFTFARGTSFIGRFFSGYLGDRLNRKNLTVLTYVSAGIGYLIFGFSNNMLFIVLGIIFLSATTLFASGSAAYMLDNLPRELSGIGMGLYMAGRAFSLLGLALFGLFLNFGLPFVQAAQLMFILTGVSYLLNSVVRFVFLDSGGRAEKLKESVLVDFIQQYKITFKVLLTAFPVFILVLLIDGISDGIYRYVNLFYVNEALGFSIGSINVMLMITLLISVPLNLKVGRFFDKHGSHKTIVLIYSFMPVTMLLLYLSQYYEYIVPINIVHILDALTPGLSVIVSTAFIGISTKSLNDILWATALNAYVRKTIPSKSVSSMMGVTSVLYNAFMLMAPLPSSIIYALYGGPILLLIIIILNTIILIILKFRSFLPNRNIDELREIFSNGTQEGN